MDAVSEAAGAMIAESCADLRATIQGLDEAALAWTPAPETSPLATLVRHAATATLYLLGGAASGRVNRQRYRAGERATSFAGDTTTEADLASLLDTLEAESRRLLGETPMDRLGEPVTFEDPTDDPPNTRAWMLFHAVEHLREHVGHAQLTRQILGR